MTKAARRSRSLRRQVRLAFLGAAAAAVLATVLSAVAFGSLLDARRDLIDRADPSLLAAERLVASLVDQETGIRGYVLSGDETSLEPFDRGRATTADLWAELVELASPLPDLPPLLARAEAAIAAWTTGYAEPTLAAARDGATGPASAQALAEGRAQFDQIRSALTRLQAGLGDARTEAKDELEATTIRLVAALAIAAAVLVGIVGGLWRLVRTRVERPLIELGDDARLVASGDLDHPVEPVGPDELRELGRAMELMRQRILADLAAVTHTRDRLEQQSAELSRSNAELEQFAYVASHDLQEPLRKVASFCQLLANRYSGQLDERGHQYIEFAVDGAKRMQELINDLLAFSRVGRVSAEEASVIAAGELAERAVGNLAIAIEDTGARVDVGPLPTVRIERALGVALFQNLIGNGIKFHRPDVAPTITVRAERDGAHHRFTVRDDGIGIEPEYAERVFVIFQRLHAKEAYAGTGIGLAMCRKIVEHHGGRIWVDEQPGPGTSISFTLPAIEGAP